MWGAKTEHCTMFEDQLRNFTVFFLAKTVQRTMHLTLHSLSLKLCGATIDLKT